MFIYSGGKKNEDKEMSGAVQNNCNVSNLQE